MADMTDWELVEFLRRISVRRRSSRITLTMEEFLRLLTIAERAIKLEEVTALLASAVLEAHSCECWYCPLVKDSSECYAIRGGNCCQCPACAAAREVR